jgi:hypothetical protein
VSLRALASSGFPTHSAHSVSWLQWGQTYPTPAQSSRAAEAGRLWKSVVPQLLTRALALTVGLEVGNSFPEHNWNGILLWVLLLETTETGMTSWV